jgi:hypothetical protein
LLKPLKKAPANAPGFFFDGSFAPGQSTCHSAYQSPSACPFTTRVRLRIMNLPAGFSAIAMGQYL